MKTSLSISAVILLAAVSAQAGVLSGPVRNPITGHSYYLLTANTWTASEAEAVSMGGHLAAVNDAAENTWITSTFSNFGGQQRSLWIGLTDQVQERTFKWTSGEPFSYSHWESGQPDNGSVYYPNEDWVHIWPSPGPRNPGYWNDKQNLTSFVEYSFLTYGVVEVPEPASLGLVTLGAAVLLLRRK